MTTIPHATTPELWAVRVDYSQYEDRSVDDITVEVGHVVAWNVKPDGGPDDDGRLIPVVRPVAHHHHGAGVPDIDNPSGAFVWRPRRERGNGDGEHWITAVAIGQYLGPIFDDLIDRFESREWLVEAVREIQKFVVVREDL